MIVLARAEVVEAGVGVEVFACVSEAVFGGEGIVLVLLAWFAV